MKKLWIILIVALIALVSCASAETISGTVTGTNYTQKSEVVGGGAGANWLSSLTVNDIQYSTGLKSIILFESDTSTFDSGAPSGSATPITIRNVTGSNIGVGTYGYMRTFDNAGSEVPGYQWIEFSSWDITGLTGDVPLYTNYSRSGVYNQTSHKTSSGLPSTLGIPLFSGAVGGALGGTHLATYLFDFSNDYTATKPGGIGINGSVTKGIYGSRVWIIDGDSGVIKTNEASVGTSQYSFTVNSQTIKISIQDSSLNWHNTSTLFTNTSAPTPTPTATQTPVTPSNPIPPGYIRSEVQCVDGQTSGAIHECDIDLKDVENDSWQNLSYEGMGSYYGTSWIDTLPNHTIDAYGAASGYTSVSRTGLPASSSKMYELIMWPSDAPAAPAGKITLYVIVNDAQSGNAITGAQVTARDSTGITQARTTGTSGTVSFQVSNSSTVWWTVYRTSYVPASGSITASAFGPDTKRVELQREVITTVPTNTIPPGGVTTAQTVNPYSPGQNGGDTGPAAQQMMIYLADNGMGLVQLAFMVTILAFLGVKLGGKR